MSQHGRRGIPFAPAEAGLEAEALRDREERLAAIFARASVGLSEIGADGRFLRVNAELCRILGRQPEEVLGRSVLDVTSPEDIDATLAALERVARTGETTSLDKRYRRPDGTDVWANSAISPLADGRHLVVTADLTARRAAETALRESEARFRLMADAVPQIVWIIDARGRIEFFNRHWADYTGASGEQAVATDLITAFIHPEDADATRERFEEAMRTGGPLLIEHRMRSKDGDYRWFLVRGEPHRDPGTGGEVRWYGASVDIHDRKRAEAALRTSAEQYRGLVETQVDLIVRIGPDGIFTFVNDTTCRVLGRPRAELLSSHWSRFVQADDHGAIVTAIEETRTRPDHRTTVEVRILTVNGVRWYSWEGYAIFDAAGRFIEKQSVGRDITERKAMEDELRQAKEAAERATLAKSKFLAAASHDLRQPMQSLLLFLDVLAPHVTPRGQDALRHLGRGLDALRDLLDSLLDISRLDAGIVDPAIEDFPLHEVVGQIGSAYAPVAAARGLELTVRDCDAAVRSDRTLLGRMVRNLVENALRYTERGSIVIGCHAVGNIQRIAVADTGIGIPPEHLKRIWEEFHQVGNPERDRNRGLGLGLAIVQRLSTLLDHPVTVRSTPGGGSVFSIDVPAGLVPTRDVPAAAEPTGRGGFAVLVDDDTIVLLALKEIFESWGYEVLVADSTERALPALAARGRRPDIVIADYRLREGRTGVDAILRVRGSCATAIPGIVLTGETDSAVERDAAAHGLAILHKPVTPRQLRLALDALARRPQAPG